MPDDVALLERMAARPALDRVDVRKRSDRHAASAFPAATSGAISDLSSASLPKN